MHASCRLINDGNDQGPDALPWLDDLIRRDQADPRKQPHQLYLTGDQIYADHVAVAVLPMLTALGNHLLGSVEHVAVQGQRWPVDQKHFPTGWRHHVAASEAKLTSTSSESHLYSLAEYCAMYLAAWSPDVWPPLSSFPQGTAAAALARFPGEAQAAGERVPDRLRALLMGIDESTLPHLDEGEPCAEGADHTALSQDVQDDLARVCAHRKKLSEAVAKERVLVERFHSGLAAVRRAFANVPCYMIFDDHEVTDDWNVTAEWVDLVTDTALGRVILRNGLLAYALFQGEGNDPLRPRRGDDEVALPDRWVVLDYAGDTRILTHHCEGVPDRLRIGPDLQRTDTEEDRSAIDPNMRWMVDFDEAVDVGMAARLRAPLQDLMSLDTLLVFGVKGSVPGEDAAGRLAELLEGHRYGDGLELLPPGTPTNNTSDAPSGYLSADPDHDRSFDLERRGPLFSAGDESDGDRVAAALGVDPGVFGNVRNADGRAYALPRAMNAALWATTWGYYLQQIVRTVSDTDVASARRLFIDQVRGRGPLPALRVGRQPYGLLPVTSLNRWQPGDAGGADLPAVRMMRLLRRTWRRSLAEVPRLPGAQEPDRVLLELLGMQPTSIQYGARTLLGPAYVRHLDAFVGLGLDARWWNQHRSMTTRLLNTLGLSQHPWLRDAIWAPQRQRVRLPLVQQEPLSASEPPTPNDIRWIRDHGYVQVRDAGLDGLPSLLARLLRHASLLEYAAAAGRILAAHGLLRDDEGFEEELVNIDPDHRTVTVWGLLDRDVPAVTGTRSIGEFLDTLQDHERPEVAELGEFRAALDLLAETPSAELARLLPETLDCASHRLDAWITALASKRLAELRSPQPEAAGIVLGGYGWLTGNGLIAGDSAGSPGGYLHAPSLEQAATAAVLRGAASRTGPTTTTRWPSTCRRGGSGRYATCWTASGKASRSGRCSVTASNAVCTRGTRIWSWTASSRRCAGSLRLPPQRRKRRARRWRPWPPATSSTA